MKNPNLHTNVYASQWMTRDNQITVDLRLKMSRCSAPLRPHHRAPQIFVWLENCSTLGHVAKFSFLADSGLLVVFKNGQSYLGVSLKMSSRWNVVFSTLLPFIVCSLNDNWNINNKLITFFSFCFFADILQKTVTGRDLSPAKTRFSRAWCGSVKFSLLQLSVTFISAYFSTHTPVAPPHQHLPHFAPKLFIANSVRLSLSAKANHRKYIGF